jgi:hypothetical protein
MTGLPKGPRGCKVALALLHHPVYNRRGEIVTTSVTSLDIHDIARAARTFDVDPYYLVTPIAAQREMIEQVSRFWTGADSSMCHPRADAIGRIRVVPDLQEAVSDFASEIGGTPWQVVTGASFQGDLLSFRQLREDIRSGRHAGVFLIFGTGWGLASEVTDAADSRLEPILGRAGFNHLSVRSAVAIVLDRLMGSDLY